MVAYHTAAARAALWTGKVTWWAKPFPRAMYSQNYKLSFKLCSWCIHKWIPPKVSVVFRVFNMSSFVVYCATTPVLEGGLSPPNHTQSRTHWVNADFSDAQSDTRFEPGTLRSQVRCLDHYTTPVLRNLTGLIPGFLEDTQFEVFRNLRIFFRDFKDTQKTQFLENRRSFSGIFRIHKKLLS